MRKIYLTLSVTFLAGISFAQNSAMQGVTEFNGAGFKEPNKIVYSGDGVTVYEGVFERGTPSIWSDDFSNGMNGANTSTNPAWSTMGTDGSVWKHDFFGASGCWDGATPTPLFSTAANGFMLFDADSVNCANPATSTMVATPVELTGSLVSPTIDLSSVTDVSITFQYQLRWTNPGSTNVLGLNLYVSQDDGVTWSAPRDILFGLSYNVATTNPYTVDINISSMVNSSPTTKIRFEWTGVTHYFWALDDIYIYPSPSYEMQLFTYQPGALYYNETRDLIGGYPIDYPIVPQSQIDNIVVKATLDNQGIQTAVNANLSYEVTNSTATVVASGNSTPADLNSVASREDSTTWAHTAVNETYTIALTADHDDISFEANTSNNSKTIGTIKVVPDSGAGVQWARDNNTIGSYTNNETEAYIMGNSFYVYNDITIYSIDASFRDKNSSGVFVTNPGVYASVVLYEIDENATSTANIFANILYSGSQSQIDYEITAPMLSSSTTTVWNKFPVNPISPTTGITLQAGKQYMAAVEYQGGADELSIEYSGRTPHEMRSVWFYGNGSNGINWYYMTTKLKIRLGLDNTASFVGMEELANSNLSLSQNVPNPSENLTAINYSLEESVEVNFEVVDVTGKIIYSENMGNKGAGLHSMNLDLTNYASGIYYYTMTAGGEKMTKKMIVTKN